MTFLKAKKLAESAATNASHAHGQAKTPHERYLATAVKELAEAVAELAKATNNAQP